jgi:hypothetical protein
LVGWGQEIWCSISGRGVLRAWSLIHNKKTIVLFERHRHVTEKSEAIACARSFPSSRLARWCTPKRIMGKNGGSRRRRGTRGRWQFSAFFPIFG